MIEISVPNTELINDRTGEFSKIHAQTLKLEHSLVSISKWEAIYKKPFLSQDPKTDNEILKYLKCMTITQNVDETVYRALSKTQLKEIGDYIRDPMTATTISNAEGKAPSRQILTSELIYYYMVAYGIPFDCEKWPLNRLLTLIRICNDKNSPKKKMGKKDLAISNTSLNAARRARSGSRG